MICLSTLFGLQHTHTHSRPFNMPNITFTFMYIFHFPGKKKTFTTSILYSKSTCSKAKLLVFDVYWFQHAHTDQNTMFPCQISHKYQKEKTSIKLCKLHLLGRVKEKQNCKRKKKNKIKKYVQNQKSIVSVLQLHICFILRFCFSFKNNNSHQM